MLVPAGILAIILTCALVPDMAMKPVTEENPRGGVWASSPAPSEPGRDVPRMWNGRGPLHLVSSR